MQRIHHLHPVQELLIELSSVSRRALSRPQTAVLTDRNVLLKPGERGVQLGPRRAQPMTKQQKWPFGPSQTKLYTNVYKQKAPYSIVLHITVCCGCFPGR